MSPIKKNPEDVARDKTHRTAGAGAESSAPTSREVKAATKPDPPDCKPDPPDCWSPSTYESLAICWVGHDDELSFEVKITLDSALFVDTVLSEDHHEEPFSLRDTTSPWPFIEGLLSYDIASPPTLSVRELEFPGGYIKEKVLYP